MIDKKKVLKALQNCIDEPKCRDCPWEDCERFECVRVNVPKSLLMDIINLDYLNDRANKMTLEEVEKCEFCYLVYEEDDPESHCFIRMETHDEDITFDRPFDKYMRVQPHLWKETYGKYWIAFDRKPKDYQIRSFKDIIRKNS